MNLENRSVVLEGLVGSVPLTHSSLTPHLTVAQNSSTDSTADFSQPCKIGCVKFSGFRLHRPQLAELSPSIVIPEQMEAIKATPGQTTSFTKAASPDKYGIRDQQITSQRCPKVRAHIQPSPGNATQTDKPTGLSKVSSTWEGILGPNRDQLIALQKKITERRVLIDGHSNNSAKVADQRSCSLFPSFSQRKTSLGSFVPPEVQQPFQTALEQIYERNKRITNNGAQRVRKLKRRYVKLLKFMSRPKKCTKESSTRGHQESNCG